MRYQRTQYYSSSTSLSTEIIGIFSFLKSILGGGTDGTYTVSITLAPNEYIYLGCNSGTTNTVAAAAERINSTIHFSNTMKPFIFFNTSSGSTHNIFVSNIFIKDFPDARGIIVNTLLPNQNIPTVNDPNFGNLNTSNTFLILYKSPNTYLINNFLNFPYLGSYKWEGTTYKYNPEIKIGLGISNYSNPTTNRILLSDIIIDNINLNNYGIKFYTGSIGEVEDNNFYYATLGNFWSSFTSANTYSAAKNAPLLYGLRLEKSIWDT